jgi:gliding motility-associated-like protein
VNPTGTTTYSVIVTTGGCSDTASTTVTVTQGPVASVTGNTLLCLGDATTLTASGGGNYSWNTGATTGSITVNPAATGNTTYTVTVTDASGCSDTATITVTVSPPPVATIMGNDTLCTGDNTVLTAGGGGNYAWNTGATSAAINVSPAATTNYSVVVSVGSCADTAYYTVTVVPNPVATAQSNVVINIGDNTTLTASGGGTYSWAPSTGLSCNNCPNPVASPTATTVYCVYVTDVNGCTDTACVTVTVEINCNPVYVPNAFSPNDDGENDIFYVYGNCISYMKLLIYNRWGERVYEGTDPKQGWNGYFKGKLQHSAVFTYYLEYELLTGEGGIKKGNISLVR